ncbi:MAG TPA: anaerobic glycerol-3-phosphate dehydrogenase subunit B [Deltaproteobacteria bacterium]|nr:anaerobic glycerol-3-phosphate dehydrogenase subunit B [Deltaproteobacteria bacterium]
MGDPWYDVVVIGGGVSGLMASIHLARRGIRTALVSRGDPVCCLSTGCIDVLAGADDPTKAMASLPKTHPYRIAGRKTVMDAIALFREIMAERGLPYSGSVRKNRGILTPIGYVKSTCLVPCTMEAADGFQEDHLHVVSFKGLRDFYPSYITSRIPGTSVSVYDAGVSTTMAIASLFDRSDFVDEFCSWLAGLEIPPGRVAVPAVLGLRDPAGIVETLSSRIGRRIFEIPTLPPSIPGLRLFRALKGAFLDRGGHIYWGAEIASVEIRSGIVEAVTLAGACRVSRVHGRAFILATGSFVGGGLYASRTSVSEPVFGLDVHVPGPRKDWFSADFFSQGHPVEASGIVVDTSFRPAASRLSNLFACGSILAGSEIMKYRCGHGMTIATGIAAARSCERSLA